MIVVTLIFLTALLVLLFISHRKFKKINYHLDVSEYGLPQFLPVGVFLYRALSGVIRFKKYREIIHQRYGAYAFEERYELFIAERLALSYLVLLAFSVMSLLLCLQGNDPMTHLERNDFGEGHKFSTYSYSLEKDGQSHEGYITLRIPEQSASRAEALAHIHQVRDQVERYLSQNEMGDWKTYSHLECPEHLSGVKIEWKSSEPLILSDSGRINYNQIEASNVVLLRATYSFQAIQLTKVYVVEVFQVPMDANESTIKSSLEEAVILASQDELVVLPEEVDGYQVQWDVKASGLNEISILLMGLLLSIVFYFLKVKSFDEQLSKRRDSIAIRLPNLINKIALLIQAGMTFHSAWLKVTEDYIKLKEQSTIRYELYEEMIITLNDMARGLSEITALEAFARRIGMKEVHRFVSIVTQNIKKGNRKLSESLIDLAYQGWQKREVIAKVKGEKAGTQMMVPVAIMLVAMMMMLLTPAVISINM